MAQIVSREITKGETFFAEVRVRDETGVPEDLAGVTKSVQVSSEISESDFAVSAGSTTGSVDIRADALQTALWPAGEHEIQLWFNYGGLADIEDEIQLKIFLTVKEAI